MQASDNGRPQQSGAAVLAFAQDLKLTRHLTRFGDQSGLRFTFARPDDGERIPGGLVDFDLVVLCVGGERPEETSVRQIRDEGIPCIVILPGLATGRERALWIEHGADDCIHQPYDHDELLARLRAAIRRRQHTDLSQTVRIGSLVLSLRERMASIDGQPLPLTTCEFALLAALAARAGEVLGREQLLEMAKGSAELAFERSIDVQVSRLRAKLRGHSRQPDIIKTVRGAGYVLVSGLTCPRAAPQ